MVTANILQRVFYIRYKERSGTAFTIDVDNKQYLVTAKHIVPDIKDEDVIELYHQDQWKNLYVTSLKTLHDDIDVAVMAPKIQLSPTHTMEPSSIGSQIGGDIYFLGFPYNLFTSVNEINRDFPLPLIKKGIVSGAGPKFEYWLLDGHNNPGFSGGPVVFRHDSGLSGLRAMGVISAFHWQKEEIWLDETKRLEYFIKYNTGIMIAYDIRFAVEAIEANPIGYSLTD